MGGALPSGDIYETFTNWAQGQGVKINGVAPAKFAGRGLGIAATRKIEAGEELVKVPFSALLTVDSVPAPFKGLYDGISVHGLLASFLVFGDPEDLDPYGSWRATWPSSGDFAESMPIMWSSTANRTVEATHKDRRCTSPKRDFCPLPPDISGRWTTTDLHNSPTTSNSGLLAKQKTRFEKDWAKVLSAVPDADRERYMYYWLLVNTRTFYYERPGKSKEKTPKEDRMALCPFADYFNHANVDEGVEPGEEIYVSYGNHSNDFLLTEYGFILPTNKSDALSLDALLLPLLPSHHRALLDEAGYLGNYTLTYDGICHRTQVAVRTQTLSAEHWQLYVAGRDGEMPAEVREREERDADAWVWRFVLGVGLREAEEVVRRFGGDGGDSGKADCRREVVVRRWVQIRDMLEGVKGTLNLGEEMRDGG